MVMNILIIKIPWRVRDHETGLSGWKCSFFLLPIFISRSTLTYRALYYGKIETQTSYLCIYVCLYLQLLLDDINSVTLERIVRGTLAELSKNLLISLSLRNKIILSKLEAVVCESYGLLFAWSPSRHYLGELLVKK